jgi:hypothetical protein
MGEGGNLLNPFPLIPALSLRGEGAPDCPAHCLYGIAKQIKGLEQH